MRNAKIEQKKNQGIPLMEPLPLVKELSSPHKEALARLQVLRSASLDYQSSRGRQSWDPAALGFLGSDPSDAKMRGSMPPPAGEEVRRNASLRKGGRGLMNQTDSVSRIEKFYREVFCFDLLLQCSLRGIMELSPPNKIVLNTSSKRIVQDKKELIVGLSACLIISGQRCQTTWARRSIAGFKLREGSVIGCKVTLRGNSMYAFLDKLINLVLPRARPSLINQAIDPDGTYNIGISDPFLFVELEHHYDLFQSLQGFDIALVMCPREKATVPLLWSGLQLLTE